jgi:hypothetical protein
MCSLRHDRRLLVPCFSTSHSAQLQPGTVDQQVDAGGAGLRRQLEAPGAPAEGGELWHRQVEAEQLEDRAAILIFGFEVILQRCPSGQHGVIERQER